MVEELHSGLIGLNTHLPQTLSVEQLGRAAQLRRKMMNMVVDGSHDAARCCSLPSVAAEALVSLNLMGRARLPVMDEKTCNIS
ncbi:unnamed protein product [Sphenostylis stenocarpa]|uniref:Uncharacterized protein n=1 Tax=Sphenostylis stenocarpa TaxID=92480 RepID=A0AA86SA89_9FABA|nr:unnamed protein product [Sphenostylis stenocarpa]